MEQLPKEKNTTEEETAPTPTTTEEDSGELTEAAETNPTMETTETDPPAITPMKQTDPEKGKNTNQNPNLLYEENLGFIPRNHGGKGDPRYVFCKFKKEYKNFDFTNEEILECVEELNLLKYLQLLQISKPNKSIDIIFRTEDAADFFINQHIEIRGKPLPFIRKAKRILKVVIKGVHPEMSNDLLLSELYDYIDHTSSIRNSDRQYNGTTFYDGTKQVFVTHLTRHIPRSIKIGNRWCLVLYKDQPVPPRRPPRVSTIVETPASEEPPHNMELEAPGPDASASESDAKSEHSENSPMITDRPMPEVSLTSKRVRVP